MAKIYWRTIKRGARAFADIPENMKAEVKALALAEVEDGIITKEQYEEITGEAFA